MNKDMKRVEGRNGFMAFIEAWGRYFCSTAATKETQIAFWNGWIAARKYDAAAVAEVLGMEAPK